MRSACPESVDQGHVLVGAGTPHDDAAAAQIIEVESVEGLAKLKHHVIGDVDHVVDGAAPGRFEPGVEPGRRPARRSRREQAWPRSAGRGPEPRIATDNASLWGQLTHGVAALGLAYAARGQRGDLARDPQGGKEIGPVRSETEVKDRVADRGGERRTDRRKPQKAP